MKFRYECRDLNGKLSTGIMEAASEADIAATLKQSGFHILAIEEQTISLLDFDLSDVIGYISSQDLLTFTVQLSTMISAGLTIVTAFEAITDQTESNSLKKVIQQMKTDIQSGLSFSEALERHEKIFGALYISMVRVGEATGSLEIVLNQLADFAEKDADLRSKIKSALTYPVVLICIASAVVAFLVSFVIPNFLSLFSSAHVELPGPTILLIQITDFLRNDYMLLFGGIALFLLAFWQIIQIPAGKRAWDTFKIRLPVIGKVVKKVNISQFSLAFGAMTKAGVPLIAALKTLRGLMGNVLYRDVIDAIQASVESGGTISEAMEKYNDRVPAMIVRMIDAGEKTGNMELMLDKINIYYDREVASAIKIMTSLIEPALILMLSGIVAFIMLAVMLPLLNMTKLVKPS